MGQREGVDTRGMLLLVISFILCMLSNSPSLSAFHVHHRWGNCRESCTKLPFLSFLLKSHVTVGQKLFSLPEVRGRWNGWWIFKENYIYLFFRMQAACVWWCGQGSPSLGNLYRICSGESSVSSWVRIYPRCQKSLDASVSYEPLLTKGTDSAFPSPLAAAGGAGCSGNVGCILPLSLLLSLLLSFSPFSGTLGTEQRSF